MKDKCLRCGKCCYLLIKGVPTNTPCLHLTEDNLCRVYKNRFKDKDIQCSKREEGQFDYEGCPYNSGRPLVINHLFK